MYKFKAGDKVVITNSTNPDSIRDRTYGDMVLTIYDRFTQEGVKMYKFEESGMFILRQSEISKAKDSSND